MLIQIEESRKAMLAEEGWPAASLGTLVVVLLTYILTLCLPPVLSAQSAPLPVAARLRSSSGPTITIPFTLQKSTALSIALVHRVPIWPKGASAEGRLVQPVYAFDRIVAPAGSIVLRHVTAVENAPRKERVQAIMQGDFSPLRSARVEFDTLLLKGGAHSTTSKMDYAEPAIAVFIAATAAMPDTDVRPGRVYRDTSGPATGQILGGGLGYKLIGIGMALAIRYQPVTAGLAAYGAAWSVYSHFLSRGQDVVFPKDTPMEIRLGEHHAAPPVGQTQPVKHKAPA